MHSLFNEIVKNIRQGTLFKNGIPVFKRRFTKWIKHTDLLYFLSKPRRMTKKYVGSIQKINQNHFQVGNYYLDERIALNQNSIIYSLGVSLEISFDSSMVNLFGCDVYMYDPTPISIEFMRNQKEKSFKFFPGIPLDPPRAHTLINIFEFINSLKLTSSCALLKSSWLPMSNQYPEKLKHDGIIE